MTEKKFSVDWFSKNVDVWTRVLAPFKGRPDLRALEIGSWEGRSACWLLENILTDKSASLLCIDSFEGNAENEQTVDSDAVYKTFKANIGAAGGADKTQLMTAPSKQALKTIIVGEYDIIYVDGSHMPKDVLMDVALAWDLLKIGGIMIMDDYLLQNDKHGTSPMKAINAFYSVFRDEIVIVNQDWQMIWRKA